MKLTVFLAICLDMHLSDSVEVLTRNGVIIGSNNLRSRDGKQIFSFTGIPYAEPPVDKLRFKESQPIKPWKGSFNATNVCPACPQIQIGQLTNLRDSIKGQENCLCLNVFSTSLNHKARLPVMLYIHGGAYKIGSTGVDPEFLLGDIVLLDINYRIGALGFATTGDGIIPGNLGMKDMVLALKWVQDNIKNFGGDPNLVTVFGSSAGAASAHLLLLSPLSKGLVHRGISMSGTGLCSWVIIPEQVVIDRTKALAVLSDCPTEPSNRLLECLQGVPLVDLMEIQSKFTDEIGLPLTSFAPVIEATNADNAFLHQNPATIESEIPWMTGINPYEAMSFPTSFLRVVEDYHLNLEEKFYLTLPKLLTLNHRYARDKIPSIVDKIKQFYFGDGPINRTNIANFDDLVTDGWFLNGVIEAVSKYKGKTYLYYYEYVQSTNVSFSSVIGPDIENTGRASHMDDLLSLFPMRSFFPNRPAMSDGDRMVSEKMVNLWTTFARYGNLTQNNVAQWDPVDKNTFKNKYLHITTSEQFQQEEDLLTKRANFWRCLDTF